MKPRGKVVYLHALTILWGTLFLLIIWTFIGLTQVKALNGVAAQVDRVSSGPSITISGRHTPSAEIVVVNSYGEVVASALDKGTGSFSFTFRVDSSDLSGLQIFGVDKADKTNAILLLDSGYTDILLPPSLIINPDIPVREERVGIGGYTFPGSTITVTLTSDGGTKKTTIETADGEGAWLSEFRQLQPGTYTVSARSRIGNLSSESSVELTIIVEPDSLLTQAIPRPVENVANAVGKAVKDTAQVILPAPITQAVGLVAPQAQQVAETVTPVASAGLLTQLLLGGRDLFYVIVQGGISALQYFGFWRKRHPWGIVYDAITKQPLMLATVRLYTLPTAAGKTRKLIETDVSSNSGVFSFNPDGGDYQIEVSKPGYRFPSHIIVGQSDGEYGHVYHGERVHLGGEAGSLDVSVPLDPAEVISLSWRQRITQFIRERLYLFTLGMLLIGFVMSLLAVLGGGKGLNLILLIFYLLVLLAQWYTYIKRKRAWGQVVDPQGKPVAGVQLNLIDPKFKKLVQRRVTSDQGKYQFVVPPGKYTIEIENVDLSLVLGEKHTYQGQEIWVEGSKPKLINLKIVVSQSDLNSVSRTQKKP